jgi:hypothetical protein
LSAVVKVDHCFFNSSRKHVINGNRLLYIPQKRFHRIVGLQGYLQFIAFRLSRLLKNVPEAVAVLWDATVGTAQFRATIAATHVPRRHGVAALSGNKEKIAPSD